MNLNGDSEANQEPAPSVFFLPKEIESPDNRSRPEVIALSPKCWIPKLDWKQERNPCSQKRQMFLIRQFFQEEDSVYLTSNQKELLDLLAKLSPAQREAVSKMLCSFLYIKEEE